MQRGKETKGPRHGRKKTAAKKKFHSFKILLFLATISEIVPIYRKMKVTKKLNEKVKLGKKYVGNNHPTYIIAEAGLNHNGSLDLAKKLVDEAKKARCDAIKFQSFQAQKRVSKITKSAKYAEKADGLQEDIYEMFKRLE